MSEDDMAALVDLITSRGVSMLNRRRVLVMMAVCLLNWLREDGQPDIGRAEAAVGAAIEAGHLMRVVHKWDARKNIPPERWLLADAARFKRARLALAMQESEGGAA